MKCADHLISREKANEGKCQIIIGINFLKILVFQIQKITWANCPTSVKHKLEMKLKNHVIIIRKLKRCQIERHISNIIYVNA